MYENDNNFLKNQLPSYYSKLISSDFLDFFKKKSKIHYFVRKYF